LNCIFCDTFRHSHSDFRLYARPLPLDCLNRSPVQHLPSMHSAVLLQNNASKLQASFYRAMLHRA